MDNIPSKSNIALALALLPTELQALFLSFDSTILSSITEIRLRKSSPIIVYILDKPYFISQYGKLINHYSPDCIEIENDEFNLTIDTICNNSYHSHINSMIKGYVTAPGGIRVGIASSAVYKDGDLHSVKNITSVCIRISKEIINCSRTVLNILYVSSLPSVIIAGPPSSGKTTLLRDAARILSSGFAGKYRKITIIDERDEIAAGFNVGLNTDVISQFSKAQGIETAVRTLSPDLIICDEIGNDSELDSIKFGFSGGVSFMVTVHARTKEDLLKRSVIRNLTSLNEFDYIVLLKDYTNEFEIYDLSEADIENSRSNNDNSIFYPGGNDDCQI